MEIGTCNLFPRLFALCCPRVFHSVGHISKVVFEMIFGGTQLDIKNFFNVHQKNNHHQLKP